jgi:crossover junction endodeoxyribonuclease RusA
MIIQLPWPDAKLNPNRSKGTHWGRTSALRKKARNDAFWLTRGVLLQNLMATGAQFNSGGPLPLVITFVQPDKRARDRDNLLAALKPSLDGIADSLGCNDSQFDPITIRREYGVKPGFVRVEVGC